MNTGIIQNRSAFSGVDNLFRSLESAFADSQRTSATSYPPYNIFRAEDNSRITIEVALAGVARSDINIEHDRKNNTLTISGCPAARDNEVPVILGIAARRFERKFFVADDLEVNGFAKMRDGILTVELTKVPNVDSTPIKIDIL